MDSTSFEYLKEQAKLAFGDKQFEKAESYYSQALAVKKCPVVLRNRALTYIKTNRFAEAENDLLQSLRLNAKDKLTLYWMGYTKLQLEKLTQAIYYLNIVNDIEPNFKDNNKMISQAKKEYQEIVSETTKLLSDKNIETKAYNKLNSFCRLNGLPNTNNLVKLMLQEKAEKKYYTWALGMFWDERKYIPLNFSEHPRKIAGFIGGGNRIATVLVQTLPIHLSKNFNDVYVYDISPGQSSFQKRILKAMQTNSMKQFAVDTKQTYLDFVQQHETAKNFPMTLIQKWADYEFSDTYQSLENDACPENIHVQEADIFQGIDKALGTNKFDAVFLSTIPGDAKTDWHTAYKYMRNWLEQGITVVHSIVTLHLLSESWQEELLLSFEDIANKEVIMFDETVGVIHIKLTPRNH